MSSYYIFDTAEGSSLSKLTSNLDAGKYAITNLKTYPENNSDAASKKYVDDEDAKSLPLSGGVLTGVVNMNSYPISNLPTPRDNDNPTTKKYVDDQLATKFSKTSLGNLDMGNKKILNVAAPTSNLQGANKAYVDSAVAGTQKSYLYHFSYSELTTGDIKFPVSRYVLPTYWIFCKGVKDTSYFHLMLHTFDTDNSIDSSVKISYELGIFDTLGRYHRHEFITERQISSYLIPGERVAVYDYKLSFADVPGTKSAFRACRLGITRTSSGTFGNESTVTCALVI